jgi:hypothetical protein
MLILVTVWPWTPKTNCPLPGNHYLYRCQTLFSIGCETGSIPLVLMWGVHQHWVSTRY